MLAKIDGRFTEGSDATDLKGATTALDESSKKPGSPMRSA